MQPSAAGSSPSRPAHRDRRRRRAAPQSRRLGPALQPSAAGSSPSWFAHRDRRRRRAAPQSRQHGPPTQPSAAGSGHTRPVHRDRRRPADRRAHPQRWLSRRNPRCSSLRSRPAPARPARLRQTASAVKIATIPTLTPLSSYFQPRFQTGDPAGSAPRPASGATRDPNLPQRGRSLADPCLAPRRSAVTTFLPARRDSGNGIGRSQRVANPGASRIAVALKVGSASTVSRAIDCTIHPARSPWKRRPGVPKPRPPRGHSARPRAAENWRAQAPSSSAAGSIGRRPSSGSIYRDRYNVQGDPGRKRGLEIGAFRAGKFPPLSAGFRGAGFRPSSAAPGAAAPAIGRGLVPVLRRETEDDAPARGGLPCVLEAPAVGGGSG